MRHREGNLPGRIATRLVVTGEAVAAAASTSTATPNVTPTLCEPERTRTELRGAQRNIIERYRSLYNLNGVGFTCLGTLSVGVKSEEDLARMRAELSASRYLTVVEGVEFLYYDFSDH